MTPADIISHPTQITLLDVMFWDMKVGALVATQNGYKKQICFYFDPSFVKSGYDIAPLRASITGNIAKNGFPVYPESDKLFGGLPSFIADSLPDHWGNLVFKEWAKQNGIRTKDLNALDRLAYIGRRGMDRVVSIDKSWTEHRSACAVSASCGHQPIPDWHLTLHSSMDFPGGTTSSVFSYNAFGALSADPSRGITSITYDNFGNPTQIQFSNVRNITNVYSATGEKLKTSSPLEVATIADAASPFDMEQDPESKTSEDMLSSQAILAQSITAYHGPIIYRNRIIDKVLFHGGYATVNGTSVTFHYYTQDYLGNNRAVINGSTGAIEQTIAYYPYGGVIADLGTPTTGQPYKFGGKELITANGLNEYDFGARRYYQAVPHFTSIDPMTEKYPWLSPYLYCANNPVNLVDPTGKIIEMPKGTSTEQIYTVLWNLKQLTDDKLVYKTQKDGTIRIKIASTGEGRKPNGTRLIRRLNSSSRTMTIVISNGGNQETRESNINASNGKGTNTTVRFNPESDPDVPILDGKTGRAISGKRPSYIGLTHEMIHAERDMRGVAFPASEEEYHAFTNKFGQPDVERIPKDDAATIGFNYINKNNITENDIRKELKIPLRATYRSYKRNK